MPWRKKNFLILFRHNEFQKEFSCEWTWNVQTSNLSWTESSLYSFSKYIPLTMKSTVLYHYYGSERRSFCRSFNTKHFALTSAVYTLVRLLQMNVWSWCVMFAFISCWTQNVSILVVLLYSHQINVNSRKFQVLGDVYYGVQIAYFAIIGSQLSIVLLSIVLIAGINSVSRMYAFVATIFVCLRKTLGKLKHLSY